MGRYIRQEVLKEIGVSGQRLLSKARIAIVGVGALGTVVAELLTRAGVGEIFLIDGDKVSLVNLQRQFLFEEKDVGKFKVVVAKNKLKKINSDVSVIVVKEFLTEKNTDELLADCGLVLDCTDNMASRNIINDCCERNKKIWIYSAASGVKGNVLVVDDPNLFRSFFRSGETFDRCEEIGVVNAVTSITASLQVAEAIKIIVRKDFCKDLIRFDVWNNSYNKIKIKK